MKFNILTVAALSNFIYHTAGYTIARAIDLPESALANAPPVTFTGPAFPGGPNITITGTVDYIFKKLNEMNPKYDAWEFPEYQEKMAQKGLIKGSTLETRSGNLEKRGRTTCNPSGDEVKNYITQCAEGVRYLRRLNGWCKAPKGRGGCARVSCSHNCGIFLCNDNNSEISVWCGNLAGDFDDIANACAKEWPRHVGIASLKGQVFRDGPPSWNTVVRSSSC